MAALILESHHMELLMQSWNDLSMEKLLSWENMGIITMSSTTVVGAAEVVDAVESETLNIDCNVDDMMIEQQECQMNEEESPIFESQWKMVQWKKKQQNAKEQRRRNATTSNPEEDIDTIAKLLGPALRQSNTGSIYSSISIRREDGLCQLKYPESRGYAMVEVNIGRCSMLTGIESNEAWKHYDYRTKILVPSAVDPLYIQAMKMVKTATKRMSQRQDGRRMMFRRVEPPTTMIEDSEDDQHHPLDRTLPRNQQKKFKRDPIVQRHRAEKRGKKNTILNYLQTVIFSAALYMITTRRSRVMYSYHYGCGYGCGC